MEHGLEKTFRSLAFGCGGATMFFPVLTPITLTYGLVRLGLDLAGVDVAGGIDELVKQL